jgi:hypothetical protein
LEKDDFDMLLRRASHYLGEVAHPPATERRAVARERLAAVSLLTVVVETLLKRVLDENEAVDSETQ